MKYVPPYGSADPDAAYVDAAPRQDGSALTGACIEHPMREIVNVITAAGLTPTDTNLAQLSQAVQNLIDKSLAALPEISEVTSQAGGLVPAFGSAPQNASPILNSAGEAVWQVGVTPVYLNQAFDFHTYYAENFFGVVGPDVPGAWVNMPPCMKSGGRLYGGFFDVKTEPAGSAVLRYTIWESGPLHGIEYVCTRQTGIGVWSPWRASGLFWESAWFDIAASGIYNFAHNMNMAEPWMYAPLLVLRVKAAMAGWAVGDIIFADGSNHDGSTGNTEFGWAINLSANNVLVTMGNSGALLCNAKSGGFGLLGKGNVECKLIIRG